jgi:mannosylglycerate hydrolase
VDPVDGTCTIEADGVRVAGANRYVDGGDGGDTYNYSPPAVDTVVDRPLGVEVEVVDPGPAYARILVTSHHSWPSHAIGDEHACSRRSDHLVDVTVRTTYELRAGERFLRVHAEFENTARDHRLRAHVPLPRRVGGSDAECAFAVVHRGLTAEGGPHERGLPTFVSRRFVDCAAGGEGLALLHDGLLEYEVVDDGAEVALTLLRATGYLSRSEPAFRPNPAGPLHTLRGAQVQGALAFDYALLPHRGDWRDARLPEAADDFLVPLEGATVPGPEEHEPATRRPPIGSGLAVDGAHVSAVLRDASGARTVRVVNLSPEPAAVTVTWGDDAPATPVDLAGEVLARDGAALRPWEILTLRSAP